MTQKEFEERTGLKTGVEEYVSIERMYMAAGNMDKDEFCRCWRQTGKNPLTQVLFRQAEIFRGQLEERNNELDDVQLKKFDLAEFLVGKACTYEDTDFYREAVKLIGQRDVTLMKMRMDLPLWDEDKKFLIEVLADKE